MVTFKHASEFYAHSVQFSDQPEPLVQPGMGWTASRTFTAAEERAEPYDFFCTVHDTMLGKVYVNATGTVPGGPSPTATSTSTATATATATATSSASPSPTPPGSGGAQEPALVSVKLRGTRFCTRRSASCRHPGVKVDIELSAPAEVRGKLKRRRGGRYRKFGSLDFGQLPAGPHRLAFKKAGGRRLKPGRYRLALRAGGERRTLKFRVRPS
jgi:hypothetical protein